MNMDAKAAARRTRAGYNRKKEAEAKQVRGDQRQIKEARSRGRKEYSKYLKEVRRAIKEAADNGESYVKVDIHEPSYSGSRRVHFTVPPYWKGVQEKIKKTLEAEGYEVAVHRTEIVNEPTGSDPLFPWTCRWLCPEVEVWW